jgi:hypothetical protein
MKGRKYYDELLLTPQAMPPLQKNFTNAAFIAHTQCASQVSTALRSWRHIITRMLEAEAREYTIALNDALKATARFHLFDADHSADNLHPLDRFYSQIDLLPIENFDELADCPTTDLRGLLVQCWDILDLILGFVYDLKASDAKEDIREAHRNLPNKYIFDVGEIPTIGEWRRLRMVERSRRITRSVSQWNDMKRKADACLEWWNKHSQNINNRVKEVIEATIELYNTQQRHNHEKLDPHNLHWRGSSGQITSQRLA